jgi:PAS domain S-box-containing protein
MVEMMPSNIKKRPKKKHSSKEGTTTRLRRAQERIGTEHRFRVAIENSLISGIAAVDLEGRQTYVNPAFCRMVGWSQEELLGATPPFVYWPPEEAENNQKGFAQALSGGGSTGSLELKLQKRSGERFDALVLFSPLKDSGGRSIGLVASIGDITETKRRVLEIEKLNRELEERMHKRTSELQKAQERAEAILESISDGFVGINREWRYTYANEAAGVFLKKSAGELIGKNVFEAFPEAKGTIFEKNFRKTFEEMVPVSFEAFYPPLKSWFECHCYPSAEGISVFFRDKTQEKAREEELARQLAITQKAEEELQIAWRAANMEQVRLQAILDTVPSGVLIIEKPDGRMTYMNRKAMQIYDREDLLGMDRKSRLQALGLRKPGGELFAPEELPLRRALEEGKAVRDIEVMVEQAGGQTLTLMVNASPLFSATGEITGAVGSIHDISQRKYAEMEIRRLNEMLHRRARELEEANLDLEAFTSTAAHDLKTPLIVMSSLSQRMLKHYEGKLDHKGEEYLHHLQTAGRQMIELVEDLLEFSRIGKGTVKFEKLDLSSMVEEIGEDLRKAWPDRKIHLGIAEGMTAQGDKGLIRSAIANLLENAFKFTKINDQPSIEFGFVGETNPPAFYIRDNGCGFNMSDVHLLFLPFQRLQKTEEYPGSGIGLAAVKRIIERHGGKIWAESEEGKGATFYFTLRGIEE